MANSLLTIDMITRKSLEILENSLVISRNVNRQYDDSFAVARVYNLNECAIGFVLIAKVVANKLARERSSHDFSVICVSTPCSFSTVFGVVVAKGRRQTIR